MAGFLVVLHDRSRRHFLGATSIARLMRHLESVKKVDPRRSHWVAKAPAGMTIEWDAEIINEIEDRLIGWRSLPGAAVENAGAVRFQRSPEGFGTALEVSLQYRPPAGEPGAAVSKMLGVDPTRQVREDLHRLKLLLESTDVAAEEEFRRAASL